jgi:hypothetical protein
MKRQQFRSKQFLLARSRVGLMLYNWAVQHPQRVVGVAGIHPIGNIASCSGVDGRDE